MADVQPNGINSAPSGSIPAHYDPHLQWIGSSMKRMLATENDSFGLAVLSESTANNIASGALTGDWTFEFAALIAAAYPHWTVRYSIFADAAQAYPAPTALQTGTAGVRYVRFTGAGAAGYQLQSTDLTAPTDIDIAVKVALDKWASPTTTQTLVAQFGSAGNRSWRFYLETDGKLKLQYTTDGTTLLGPDSSSVTVAAGASVADAATIWVRATFKANNGSAQRVTTFYTSSDGRSWTQLGTAVTTAGAITLFASTAPYELGARTNTTDVSTGNFFEVLFLSGIDSGSPYGSVPVIAPIFVDNWGQSSSLSPTATGAPILHFAIGAVSGMGLSYLSDTTRLPKLLPPYGARAVFMATSHNDTNLVGKNWAATWSTWITNVKSYTPHGSPVIVTQNPRFAPATNIKDHEQRREQLLAFAVELGLPAFDAYQAFVDTGIASSYVQSDGVHPTVALGVGNRSGAQVWASDLYRAMLAISG